MKERLLLLGCILALALSLIGCGGGGGGGPKTYTVSGTVTLEEGASVTEVSITFSNGAEAVYPNEDGFWEKTGLSGTVRITPVLDGYSFNPPYAEVDGENRAVNFVGEKVSATFTISGRVTDGADGPGLSDVTITVTGNFGTKTCDTDDNGEWSIGGVYGAVTVTPTKGDWIFDPEKRELEVESDTGDLDFTGRQVYSISGFVKDGNNSGLQGVTITATGDFGERSAVSIAPSGYWKIDKVYGAVTVTPNKDDKWNFTPPKYELEISGNTSNVNFIGVLILAGTSPVAGGGYHSLALKSNGTVWSWGQNNHGQLGNGNGGMYTDDKSTIPVQVKDYTGSGWLEGVIAIAAGTYHSLALTSDGKVWAWGGNDYGQLGDNSTERSLLPSKVKDSTGLSNVIAIAAGDWHSLALTSSGEVWAWGYNDEGQLGYETWGENKYYPIPAKVNGLSNVIAIAAGHKHSLALTSDGEVWAWGRNYSGQLGDGTYHNNRFTPQKVVKDSTGSSYLSDVIAIAAGSEHSLALTSDGEVWAWGNNTHGQLGDGTNSTRLTPVRVEDSDGEFLSGINAIAAGTTHSLALQPIGGVVYTWGGNQYGQLGDKTMVSRNYAAPATGSITNVIAIAGGGSHSLVVWSGGSVYTWGWNIYGQLGNGTTDDRNYAGQVWQGFSLNN